jgi:hypothetical protein
MLRIVVALSRQVADEIGFAGQIFNEWLFVHWFTRIIL